MRRMSQEIGHVLLSALTVTREDLTNCSPKMELGKLILSVMKVQVGNKQLKRRENTCCRFN
jgi:hypothetical protein